MIIVMYFRLPETFFLLLSGLPETVISDVIMHVLMAS